MFKTNNFGTKVKSLVFSFAVLAAGAFLTDAFTDLRMVPPAKAATISEMTYTPGFECSGATLTVKGTGLSLVSSAQLYQDTSGTYLTSSGVVGDNSSITLNFSQCSEAGYTQVRFRDSSLAVIMTSFVTVGLVLDTLSPNYGPTTGGTITIKGSGLRSANRVFVDGVVYDTGYQTNNGSFSFLMPPHAAGTVKVQVREWEELGYVPPSFLKVAHATYTRYSNELSYTYGATIISDIFPDYICTGGDVVYIKGLNFTQVPWLRPLFNDTYYSGSPIDDISARGQASSSTPGIPGNVPLKLSNVPGGGSIVSNSLNINVRKKPIITGVSPLYSDRNNPQPLTLTFDLSTPLLHSTPGYGLGVSVYTGTGNFPVSPTGATANSITIPAPFKSDYTALSGGLTFYSHGSGGVALEAYNLIPTGDVLYAPRAALGYANTVCNTNYFYFKFNPYLESLNVTNGSVGDLITVNGTDFMESIGATVYNPVLMFGATAVTPELGFSMTKLQFKVPSLPAGTYQVKVSVNGRLSSNYINFTINPTVTTYTLSANYSGIGTITSSPAGINCPGTCSASFASGANVTITATPSVGQQFNAWSGACSGYGSNPVCTVAMTENKAATAWFGAIVTNYDLTVTKVGSGTVTSVPLGINCGAACTATYSNGTTVTLTAVPASGYSFSGWSGGGCSGTGTCTILLSSTMTVQATFVTAPTLSATTPVNGSITSSGGTGSNLSCGAICSVTKGMGDTVTVNAVPALGYFFSSWGAGACFGQGATCTVTMDVSKSVGTASFSLLPPINYTLSANVPVNGMITSTGGSAPHLSCSGTCSVSKPSGTVVILSATPASGYIFSGWGGACSGTGSCTLTMSTNRNVSATFAVAPPPSPPSSSGNALNPCWDIQFDGQPVLINGVPNSGIMQYDPTGGLPAPEHEACMWAPDNDAYTVIYGKGWLWDTNLGWISMYCDDEDGNPATPLTNMGIPCGTIKYGVWMEGYGATNPGRLHGFAWGDNVGYISFNCAETGTCATSGYYVQPDVTTDPWNPSSVCTGYVNKSAPVSCAPLGPGISHAWSDNVGWLNLTGVRFPWFWLIDAPVRVELIITPNPLTVNKNTAPVADNNDFYRMDLKMTKLNGTAIDPSRYAITFTPVWAKDSVSYDQTLGIVPDCKSLAQGGSCAASKPLSFASFGAYGALTPMAYTAPVKSAAPTTSMNGYDKDGNGTIDFSYENFLVPAGVTKPPVHELILGNVRASVIRTADGLCSFGTIGATCGLKDVSAGGQNFGFVPAVEVTELLDSLNGETIAANYLMPNLLTYRTACRKNLAGCAGASVDFRTYVSYPYELVYNDDPPDDESEIAGAECKDPNNVLIPQTLAWNGQFAFTPVFTDAGAGCLTEGPLTAKDPTVFTVVQHGATKYYSNKLPRKTGSLIYNPVADVKGSIYSTGVSNPQTGAAYRSIGDISTNVLREQIVRNVYNIIGGITATMQPQSITVSGYNVGGFVATPTSAILTLMPDTAGVPKVYYKNGNNVMFDSGGVDISWRGERTFIVMGADVYIKSNLYVATGTVSPKPKLGIIVLKDEQFQKGGNVYIASNVTNIQANIYADGSVFSYDPLAPSPINAKREPIFTDETRRRSVLLNQIFIEGSLASQNTIGGAVYMPNPILGDGSVESAEEGNYGTAPKGRSRARLYDLNFLRYYGLVYERDADGNAVDKNLSGAIEDSPYPAGDLVPVSQVDSSVKGAQGMPAGSYSPAYILFDPPTATLPGFSVLSGAEVKIGPQ